MIISQDNEMRREIKCDGCICSSRIGLKEIRAWIIYTKNKSNSKIKSASIGRLSIQIHSMRHTENEVICIHCAHLCTSFHIDFLLISLVLEMLRLSHSGIELVPSMCACVCERAIFINQFKNRQMSCTRIVNRQ